MLVKQRKKHMASLRAVTSGGNLERTGSLKVLYMNLQKLGFNWRSFEEPKEGLNMTYSMEWLVTKSSLCF